MQADAYPFADRTEAGKALGARLRRELDNAGPLLVLGLPRGGVPVAAEVARALHAPLDVLTVRKVGLPSQPELAIGAVTAHGEVHDLMAALSGVDSETFARLASRERLELARRERVYRAGRAPLQLAGRTVVLVDDGLATGSTMRAAIRAARDGGAARVIAAVPVAAPQAAQQLAKEADAVIALAMPAALSAIGQWYEDFSQLDDATVCALLTQARQPPEADESAPDAPPA